MVIYVCLSRMNAIEIRINKGNMMPRWVEKSLKLKPDDADSAMISGEDQISKFVTEYSQNGSRYTEGTGRQYDALFIKDSIPIKNPEQLEKIYAALKKVATTDSLGNMIVSPEQFSNLKNNIVSKQKSEIELLEKVRDGNLQFLVDYCKSGEDREKFYEIMSLGIDERNRKPNDRGKTALFIASKNSRTDILNFIIQNAKKDAQGRKLLANHLVQRNQEGKNVLHESAGIPNNANTLKLLCTTAAELASGDEKTEDLVKYVNLPDAEFGSTALHFSARRCNFANYMALAEAGADKLAKAKNGMIPIQVIQYANINESKAFMLELLKKNDGISYFKKRHGYDLSENKLSPGLLEKIVEIDLNIDLQDNSRAQLTAFKDCMRLISSTKSNMVSDLTVILSNFGAINYSAIKEGDLQNDESGAAQLLMSILKKANAIVPKSQDDKGKEDCLKAKDAFIRAEILLNIKGFEQTNREAFHNYGFGLLINQHPQLALDGFRQINPGLLRDNEKDILAKRLVLANSYIVLNQLQQMPSPSSLTSFFSKNTAQAAIKTIEQFHENLRTVTSTSDMIKLIETLPNIEYISPLKQTLAKELAAARLIPQMVGKQQP